MDKKIKIMTDSASDIPKELELELNIRILSFPIVIGDVGYLERVDFTNDEFYQKLLTVSSIPTTSQITIMTFIEEYKKIFDEGFKELIYVSINAKGSNTYNAANMAVNQFFDEYPEAKGKFKIYVVDSKTYTMVYGYAVIKAAQKIQKGVGSGEILAYLDDWFNSVVAYFAPYTLEFAKKSGRISVAAAFVGELMGLRPIIKVCNGEMEIVEKVRGDKAIIKSLLKYANEARVPKTEYFTLRAMLDHEADEISDEAKKLFKCKSYGCFYVGACIVINAGPKLVGIAVKGEHKKL